MIIWRFGILKSILYTAICLGGVTAARTTAATLDANDLHDVLVGQYMNGKWEDLEKDLTAKKLEIDKFTGVEAADMKYIRQTMAECRPAWWAKCKENQLFEFRPVVWGHGLRASFDPRQTLEWSIKFNSSIAVVSFKWNAADMDSADKAKDEGGYSKGDLVDWKVWQVMGAAEADAMVPFQSQVGMTAVQKQQLQRFTDFYGNLTGIYYGTPTARRWALALSCAAWLKVNTSVAIVNSRKAAGSMFLAEIVSHRAKYPSIKLPETVPDEHSEAAICTALEKWIAVHPWTLAEDKALREELKTFATTNKHDLPQTGRVRLPNAQKVCAGSDGRRCESGRPRRSG